MTITELTHYEDKVAILHLRDGEIVTARIVLVDAEYEDIIVDIINTNRPGQYKGPDNSAYTISASDIASAGEISS
jgi:hypothetical protein